MKFPKALIEYYHLKNLKELKNILYKLEHHEIVLLIKDKVDNDYIAKSDNGDNSELVNIFYNMVEDMKFRIRNRIKQLEAKNNEKINYIKWQQ